jgi:fermentation-respiration switch protein FrsA (DUF1100 family)
MIIRIVITLSIIVVLVFGLTGSIPYFVYNYVIKRKTPMPGMPEYAQQKKLQQETAWIDIQPHKIVQIKSFDGLTLEGLYLENPSSTHSIIIAHGYSGDARQLSGFAQLFYENMGFNVLLPHARGHGASGGTYIGFGWHERLDIQGWIDWIKTSTHNPPSAGIQIALFGVSMGAATVLMTGGDNPPPELKVIIEDCGYTSAEAELLYQMKMQYYIQSKALLSALSRLTKKRAGFFLEEASTINQVKKITVPTLFIHGDSDTFVPTNMVYQLYEACGAPKELLIIKGAAHGMAYTTAPQEYTMRVMEFLEKYLPLKTAYPDQ